jgi:hypothetical protein
MGDNARRERRQRDLAPEPTAATSVVGGEPGGSDRGKALSEDSEKVVGVLGGNLNRGDASAPFLLGEGDPANVGMPRQTHEPFAAGGVTDRRSLGLRGAQRDHVRIVNEALTVRKRSNERPLDT